MTIQEIIESKKYIENKRRPDFKTDYRHKRMNIKLSCEIPEIKVEMYLRRSLDLPENFSVGLILLTPNPIMNRELVIYRCQGPHGGQSATGSVDDLHNSYHVHCYSNSDLAARKRKASYVDDQNVGFDSFEGAILKFLDACNIADNNGIFAMERKQLGQFTIFDFMN